MFDAALPETLNNVLPSSFKCHFDGRSPEKSRSFHDAGISRFTRDDIHWSSALNEFYQSSRILVTGASGYLASALIEILASLDFPFLALTRGPVPRDSRFRDSLKTFDYLNRNAWDSLLQPGDVIFHLAGQTSVPAAEKNPTSDFQANVLPLIRLLQALKSQSFCPTLIYASTATAAGMCLELPAVESAIENPLTVYDRHKLASEKCLAAAVLQGSLHGCSLRLPNIYGPGKKSGSPDRGIFNRMLEKAFRGEDIPLYRPGHFLRDFLFIEDCARAFLYAGYHAQKLKGRAFFVGTGRGVSLETAFNQARDQSNQIFSQNSRVLMMDAPEPLGALEQRDFYADSAAFRNLTGWNPWVSLEEGVRKTLEWHRDCADAALSAGILS